MRLQYLSDLHIEYGNDWVDCIVPSSKYLILAGDIAPAFYSKLPLFYDWCHQNFHLTIHVPGNHEYFGTSIGEGDIKLKELCERYDIIYAQKKIVKIEETRILACTLWTNSNLMCNDYKHVKYFNTDDRIEIHRDHLSFLKSNIDNEAVVVTHHAPLIEGSQKPEHIGDRKTSLYCNNLPDLVDSSKAWIYGHTHYVSDLRRDSGVIVTTNPIGNRKEKLPYAKSAILEI